MPRAHSSSALARLGRAAGWRLLAIIVAAAVVAYFWHDRLDLQAVHEYAQRLNGGVAFALLVLLPLVGFPASVLHVAAGIRFGPVLGLVLVGISIGIQLLVSYAVVYRWRDRFARRFSHVVRKIPPGAHASVAIFAVLIPGMPFAVVNYTLPLVGVRLRTYLLCCWPIHLLRATITVLLGGETGQFTVTRLLVLGSYALVLTAASWWLYRRLRRQLADPSAAEDGRMQPA